MGVFAIGVKKSSNCYDYVDVSYWDATSTSAAGTYVEGVGWESIEDEGEEFIVLIPLGIVPWESVWVQGYRPTSIRVFFTGPSTVDLYLLQREDNSSDVLLLAQEGYSSGDLINIEESSYSSETTKLSSFAVVNDPSVGTITVTNITLCF